MSKFDNVSSLAQALVNSGVLKFGSFKLKSGAISPYYIDLAQLLSSPTIFKQVIEMIAEKASEIMSLMKVDKLASVELKGALILPSIACKLNLPCFVVRKESKAYGVAGRIAGEEIKQGDQILFFDDVVSDAGSKIESIEPIELSGGRVCAVLVVVDREQGGKENLERRGYKLYSVATISDIIESLLDSQSISEEQAQKVLEFVKKH